jgi:hypothetical protein
MSKKYKWMLFTYPQDSIIPVDPHKVIESQVRKWGWNGEIPEDMIRNSILLMREQIANRVLYDYNSHIQFDVKSEYCRLHIPQIAFKDTSEDDRYEIGKKGIAKSDHGMTYEQIHTKLGALLKDYADVALLYSAGGIADSCDIQYA